MTTSETFYIPERRLPYHPLAELFPMMTTEELKKLAEDIKANGQRHIIILLEGLILDGRNRYEACLLAGVKPKTKDFRDCPMGRDPLQYVLSQNMHRRHLDASQRADVAAKLAVLWAKDSTSERSSTITIPANLRDIHSGTATAAAASALNVSTRSVEHAIKVQKDGSPALQTAVTAGEVSVSAAAQVSTLPKPEQENLLREGPKAITEKAKQLKAGKKTAAAGKKKPAASKNTSPVAGVAPEVPQEQAAVPAPASEPGAVAPATGTRMHQLPAEMQQILRRGLAGEEPLCHQHFVTHDVAGAQSKLSAVIQELIAEETNWSIGVMVFRLPHTGNVTAARAQAAPKPQSTIREQRRYAKSLREELDM